MLEQVLVQPRKAYWDLQDHITPEMRKILVEWLCDFCVELKLEQETFFLMVSAACVPPLSTFLAPCLPRAPILMQPAPEMQISHLDRYLGKVRVTRANFQLVGITALWIAAKFEEVYYPAAAQLLEMTDDAYKWAGGGEPMLCPHVCL